MYVLIDNRRSRDQDAFKPLDSELKERLISTRKRRHEEDDECNVKRRDLKI